MYIKILFADIMFSSIMLIIWKTYYDVALKWITLNYPEKQETTVFQQNTKKGQKQN